jgi:hypothetical protein
MASTSSASVESTKEPQHLDVSWDDIRNWNLTREACEQKVAAALRVKLDRLGETAWLAECEHEMGWSRRTAYRHLNPEQMEAAREDARERRANVPSVGTSAVRPQPKCCTKHYDGVGHWLHADGCPSAPRPPLHEQARLIAQARQNEKLAAEPFSPEYELGMGEPTTWVPRLIEAFEYAAAAISGNDRVLGRLGTEGRVRVRTAAQAVLDALDPKDGAA